ncbi:hypothetical protein N665_0124s0054 [Sinapis alba]|nr:hypothetical protein N665_0124s0054 [Sinapis alba]
MSGNGKVYTLEEVSHHTSSKHCLIVISGKVYDVTKFLHDHPGGDEVIVTAAGRDATDDFEDVGHSSDAKALLDEFYIADIGSATVLTETKFVPPPKPTESN